MITMDVDQEAPVSGQADTETNNVKNGRVTQQFKGALDPVNTVVGRMVVNPANYQDLIHGTSDALVVEPFQGRQAEIVALVERAAQPAMDQTARGRSLMLGVWSAYGVVLAACGAICFGEARRTRA